MVVEYWPETRTRYDNRTTPNNELQGRATNSEQRTANQRLSESASKQSCRNCGRIDPATACSSLKNCFTSSTSTGTLRGGSRNISLMEIRRAHRLTPVTQ